MALMIGYMYGASYGLAEVACELVLCAVVSIIIFSALGID